MNKLENALAIKLLEFAKADQIGAAKLIKRQCEANSAFAEKSLFWRFSNMRPDNSSPVVVFEEGVLDE